MVGKEAVLWDRFAKIYDMFMKSDKKAYSVISEFIAQSINKDMHVLEIASGTGNVALKIAEHSKYVHGADISSEMIEIAKQKAAKKGAGNVIFSVQDAECLSFDDGSYDVVILANALHIMPEPEKVIEEAKRVLKEDGIFIAPTFLHDENKKSRRASKLMELTGFKAYHKWNSSNYLNYIENAGFEVTCYSLIYASLPLMYIEAKKTKNSDENLIGKSACVYHDLVASIMAALDAKDHFTADHSARVSDMAEKVCRFMHISDSSSEAIHMASHVHDIGKIGIPDAVLLKPGSLTDDEFEIMKQHPSIGAMILSKSDALSDISKIVLYHHERWDGSGYPEGLSGEEIPLGSRIISICDSIDAMAADRPYRKALPLSECRREIVDNSGKMYDPEIVKLVDENWDNIVGK